MTNTNNYSDEMVNALVEELEDFAEYDNVTYEVWAIGYDGNDCVTDTEMLLGKFDDHEAAVSYASKIALADIVHKAAEENTNNIPAENLAYITVEVETVVDDEDEGTMNIGTIYINHIWLSEEDGPEEDEYANIAELTSNDFELLEDGSIKISRELLKNFNKNDNVQVMYVDEDNQPIMTYKIISKTTDNDFICEFVY